MDNRFHKVELEDLFGDFYIISECIKCGQIYNREVDENGFWFYCSEKYFARLLFEESCCPYQPGYRLSSARYVERDVKTENVFFDKKERELINKLEQDLTCKEKEEIECRLLTIKKIKGDISFFQNSSKIIENNFETFIDSGNVASDLEIAKKYVVLDVETNGTRSRKDDLLSISIYDPFNGLIYNRFLPLEMQPFVVTTFINGITDSLIENKTHLSQEEFDDVVKRFNLTNRTILCFGGGKKPFDESFLKNYLKRQKIKSPKLLFENMKKHFNIISRKLGVGKKDNICRALGITGVSDIHTSYNDCILEWKMFEKVYNKELMFIDNNIYEYSSDYIIPVTYLNSRLEKIINANYPIREIIPTLVYKYKITNSNIKKFPQNVTGVSIENAIKYVLGAKKQDNIDFLIENKNKLKFIGCTENENLEIPVALCNDGMISALNLRDKEIVESINETSKIILDNIQPVANYIKNEIFHNEDLMDQELIITDNKILALCDISSSKTVLEIKTTNIMNDKGFLRSDYSKQLFYQRKERDIYIMQIDFNVGEDVPKYKKGVTFFIYNVNFD